MTFTFLNTKTEAKRWNSNRGLKREGNLGPPTKAASIAEAQPMLSAGTVELYCTLGITRQMLPISFGIHYV